MDASLAVAALLLIAVAFQLQRLVKLAELRQRDRGTPEVISSVGLRFPVLPAPYQSTVEGAPQ